MPDSPRRSTALLWGGVLLCVLSVASIALPTAFFAQVASTRGIALGNGPTHVRLPAGKQYGIYFDDTDNSGYSEQCSVTDVHGQQVRLHDPGWTVSGSDTEMLDIVFNTGSGNLTIDCSSSAERVTTRPVPSLKAVLLGLLLATALGCAGVTSLVARTRLRSAQPLAALTSARGAHLPVPPPPAWYPDPRSPDRMRYWDGSTWTEHIHN